MSQPGLVELPRSGEYTTNELGDLFGVARSTVYRAVARSRTSVPAARSVSGAVHHAERRVTTPRPEPTPQTGSLSVSSTPAIAVHPNAASRAASG